MVERAWGFRKPTAQTLLRVAQSYKQEGDKGVIVEPGGQRFTFWQGTLQANLEPSTSRTGTGYTKAAFRFLTLDPDNGAKAHLKQTALEDECINRDEFQIAFDGEYVSGIFRYGRYEVLWPGPRTLYGKADANIASGSTGTVSLYESTTTDSTINLTGVHNITDQQADINKWVEVVPMEVWGLWVLKPLECPG